jgi:Porin subfamily
MKLLKTLLLASATGLVAVSGASAADLGAKKPSPVEYVKACYNPLWGTSGGFVIPGTQTCLRVFGQARFDMAYQNQFFRTGAGSSAPYGTRGGGLIGLDAITPSEYGNVRAFIQAGFLYRTGNQRTGTGTRQGVFVDAGFANGISGGGQAGTEFLFSGFIQFAGFTAGRTASFFDPFFVPEIIGATFRSAPGNVNLLAYTAALGNGVTATISLEDGFIRRYPIASQNVPIAAGGVGVLNGPFGLQGSNLMPHIVGAVQVDQAWGSAKVAGVLTHVRPAFTVGGAGANFVLPGALAGTGTVPSTKFGFAVMGALKINLPMIAAGDNFVITGVYGQGATSYVFSNQWGGSLGQTQGAGGAQFAVGDATVDAVTGSFRLTKAWAVSAGFQHFWTPTISSTVFGSYASYDRPGANPVGAFSAQDLSRDAKMWAVGLNTIWTPVRGLAIALEGAYVNFDPQGRVYDLNKNSRFDNVAACSTAGGAFCRTKGQDGAGQVRLRITRDF